MWKKRQRERDRKDRKKKDKERGKRKVSYLNNKEKKEPKNSRESCCTALYLYPFILYKCAKMEF